jgi:hypothetical protein
MTTTLLATPTWLTTLEALERHLDTQATLIEGGRYAEVVAFVPPADLPILPRALVTRASELLDRAQALTDQGAALREDTLRRLAQPRLLAFAGPPVPAYVDQRA